jgi:REP element-mobilizing transposase RayT
MEWLPVFSRPEPAGLLLESLRFLREAHGLQLYGYVIMENHLHLVAQAQRLDKCLYSFKAYTAARIISHLEDRKEESLLVRLRFSRRAHKSDREYQFWQEGCHAELILNDAMMREKLTYLHHNPVRRGYVDLPEQWRYSSARNYAGETGMIDIDRW